MHPTLPLASSSTTSFHQFIESLSEDPDLASTALELEALQSIYGEEAFRLHDPAEYARPEGNGHGTRPGRGDEGEGGTKLRFEAVLPLPEDQGVQVTVLITLPPGYPESDHPPQLQLLDRYVGDFGVDSGLFGRILRTYFSIPPPDGDGIPFSPGEVAVWEGLEHVLKICQEWYTSNLHSNHESDLLRAPNTTSSAHDPPLSSRRQLEAESASSPPPPPADLPEGIEIFVTEPIVDRKSVFIGRSVRLTDPSLIPLILSHLLTDKKIAKAAHPIIHAYRISGPTTAGPSGAETIYQDNDDDGESAAGSRIAHLLQILDVKDVLVIVSRWFGGVHLGADRFKHIGQVARDALEIGGFLDEGKGGGGKGGAGAGKGGKKGGK